MASGEAAPDSYKVHVQAEVDVKAIRARIGMTQAAFAEALRDHAEDLCNEDEWRMDVTDATGLVLFTLVLSTIESAAVIGRGLGS